MQSKLNSQTTALILNSLDAPDKPQNPFKFVKLFCPKMYKHFEITNLFFLSEKVETYNGQVQVNVSLVNVLVTESRGITPLCEM